MPDQLSNLGRRRRSRRFAPSAWLADLESRVLLSTLHQPALHQPAAPALRRPRAVSLPQHAHSNRVTPIAEVNAQYASFLADFAQIEQAYLDSLSSGSTSSVTVTASLTAPYVQNSVLMQVDNAAVFGPQGTFAAPVTATATFAGITVGTFTLTGRQGNTLTVNPASSTPVNLNQGVVLSASVQNTSQSSASAIFPSFILNRTQLMAVNLVNYFNTLPLKLPAFNAPPHTPTQRGALQLYVYQQIVGASGTSLQQSLLGIILPTTPGPDLTIYNAAVLSAIEQSRQQVLGGILQIFSGRLKVNTPVPGNRLGPLAGTSSGTGTSTTGTSTTTSSTSGTTTGP